MPGLPLRKARKMRKQIQDDHDLFDEQYRNFAWAIDPKNPLVNELAMIDKLLDEIVEILDFVQRDLTGQPQKAPGGRPTVASCEQILRSAILMQLRGLHYRQLAEEIDASMLYRKFTRFYGKKVPHFTRLNELIKAISPETMEKANEAIVRLGIKKKVENGKSIRHDTTVSETNISYPVDARLLSDSVRVMDRLLKSLREAAPQISFRYHNHTRAVKKRAYRIVMAKGKNVETRRKAWYKTLLDYQEKVRGYVAGALEAIDRERSIGLPILVEVMGIVNELKEILSLTEIIHNQAYRRVMLGEKVSAHDNSFRYLKPIPTLFVAAKKDRPPSSVTSSTWRRVVRDLSRFTKFTKAILATAMSCKVRSIVTKIFSVARPSV